MVKSNVQESDPISIEWKRGDKSGVTERFFQNEDKLYIFNKEIKLDVTLLFNKKTGKLRKKLLVIRIIKHKLDKAINVGESTIDLSQYMYVNDPMHQYIDIKSFTVMYSIKMDSRESSDEIPSSPSVHYEKSAFNVKPHEAPPLVKKEKPQIKREKSTAIAFFSKSSLKPPASFTDDTKPSEEFHMASTVINSMIKQRWDGYYPKLAYGIMKTLEYYAVMDESRSSMIDFIEFFTDMLYSIRVAQTTGILYKISNLVCLSEMMEGFTSQRVFYLRENIIQLANELYQQYSKDIIDQIMGIISPIFTDGCDINIVVHRLVEFYVFFSQKFKTPEYITQFTISNVFDEIDIALVNKLIEMESLQYHMIIQWSSFLTALSTDIQYEFLIFSQCVNLLKLGSRATPDIVDEICPEIEPSLAAFLFSKMKPDEILDTVPDYSQYLITNVPSGYSSEQEFQLDYSIILIEFRKMDMSKVQYTEREYAHIFSTAGD